MRFGFDSHFDYQTGAVKYVHPDLEIQFLTPERGRGKNTPYSIKQLHIKAEGLRYLYILQNYSFEMQHSGITIRLPEPEAFVLQKILASQERKDSFKKEKDLSAAKNIGALCLQDKKRRERLEAIFTTTPVKWQKKILKSIEAVSGDIYSFLVKIK